MSEKPITWHLTTFGVVFFGVVFVVAYVAIAGLVYRWARGLKDWSCTKEEFAPYVMGWCWPLILPMQVLFICWRLGAGEPTSKSKLPKAEVVERE